MWKIIVGGIVLWLLMATLLASACHEVFTNTAACHPGLVTTEKDGQKSTTIACTAR